MPPSNIMLPESQAWLRDLSLTLPVVAFERSFRYCRSLLQEEKPALLLSAIEPLAKHRHTHTHHHTHQLSDRTNTIVSSTAHGSLGKERSGNTHGESEHQMEQRATDDYSALH